MSLYQQSVPMFTRYMKNLSVLLKKGEEFADMRGIKHEVFLNSHLYPDMRGIVFQVQACSNTAKFIPERLGGQPAIALEDNETTFEELQARITRTIEILEEVKPEWLDGKENEEMIMSAKIGDFRFATKQQYLSQFAVPYFHFHLSICYCIMRSLGVDVGAMDYLKDVLVEA